MQTFVIKQAGKYFSLGGRNGQKPVFSEHAISSDGTTCLLFSSQQAAQDAVNFRGLSGCTVQPLISEGSRIQFEDDDGNKTVVMIIRVLEGGFFAYLTPEGEEAVNNIEDDGVSIL